MKLLFLFTNLLSMYKVVWQNHQIDIPLYENTSNYYDLPKPTLYNEKGYILNENYYITKGVKNTFLSVVNSKYVRNFEVIYRVNYYDLGLSHDQTIVFNIVDITGPEFVYVPELIGRVGDSLKSEKEILKQLIYKDNYYDNELLSVSIKGLNLVNINIPGNYTLTYELIDPSNNITRINGIYTIINTIPPEITYKDPISIEYNEKFNYRDYFKITDKYDNNLIIDFDDTNVNYQKIGTYLISLKATNQAGLSTSITTTLTIKDSKPPNLILKENVLINIYEYEFRPSSLILDVYDNYDTLNISDVKIYGNVLISELGKYEISFEVFDSSNNKIVKKVTVEVKDLLKPEIILNNDLEINVFSENINYYNYFTFSDNYDDYNDLIITFNDKLVKYNKLGEYVLEVSVTDQSKNKKQMTFIVIIKDNLKPFVEQVNDIYIKDFKEMKLSELTSNFFIEDNYDDAKDISVMIIGLVNYLEVNSYLVNVSFKDTSLNETLLEVLIHVVDIYPPTLLLSTDYLIYYIGEEFIDYKQYIIDYYDNYTKKDDLVLEIIDNIDYYNRGYYYVFIYVSDFSNNKTKKSIKVIVDDLLKEKLIYGSEIHLKLNETFIPYTNISFSDKVVKTDYSLINVNSDIPGIYEVIYYARDNTGYSEYYVQLVYVSNSLVKSFVKDNLMSIIINIGFGISIVFYFVKKYKKKKKFDN